MPRLRLLALSVLLSLCAAASATRAEPQPAAPPADQPTSRVVLARGDYAARFYPVAPGLPLNGLVVFGSGDGGWSYWEERVCHHLAARGFAVAGVDFKTYAATGYDADILRRDCAVFVAELRRLTPDSAATPVFYGGWSMGAEQAVAAAAVPPEARPAGLHGLLLVSPGARGRYGLHLRDRMGMAPTGPDTFALRELAPRAADLRFAVFHGGLDPIDDLDWSQGLTLDYRRWTVPRVFHDYAGASDAFLVELDQALLWLLEKPSAPRTTP